MVGCLANCFKKLNRRQAPDGIPTGTFRRQRINRVVGSVVLHVSQHVVVIVVREPPLVKPARVQGRRDRRRLNEDNSFTHPHTSRLRVVDPFLGLAFLAYFRRAGLPKHDAPACWCGPFRARTPGTRSHGEMAEKGILAIERLVRRTVLRSCVISPVAQVDGRLHQLHSKGVRKCRVGEKTAHDVQKCPARTLVLSDLIMGVRRGKLQRMLTS